MSEVATLPAGVTTVRHLNVLIAYSGTEVGNVDRRFGEPDEVQASRAHLIRPLNPIKYVVQAPNGGSEFMDLSGTSDDELPEGPSTDGLFIDRPGIALGLNTADCIAMALYNKKTGTNGSVLGVIHAGRKGVDGGIHEAAVGHMVEAHGVAKDAIRAYFGPCIGPDSYYYPEISAEQLADPKWNKFIDRRNGNYHIDLASRVVKDLTELGIDPNHIQMTGVDVGADDSRYFSHTRGKRTGEPKARNGFVAMLGTG